MPAGMAVNVLVVCIELRITKLSPEKFSAAFGEIWIISTCEKCLSSIFQNNLEPLPSKLEMRETATGQNRGSPVSNNLNSANIWANEPDLRDIS
jgi:hypothetical protein